MLKRLLHAGAPPGTADYDGRTCCHIAAAEGHMGAVRVNVHMHACLFAIMSVSAHAMCAQKERILRMPRAGTLLHVRPSKLEARCRCK